MDTYKNFIAAAALPSAAMFFSLAAAVLTGQAEINQFDLPVHYAAAAAACVSFCAAVIRIIRGGGSYRKTRVIIRLILLSTVCGYGALSVYYRCLPGPAAHTAELMSGFEADVVSMKKGRHSTAVEIVHTGTPSFKAAAWMKNGTEACQGDRLFIREAPVLIDSGIGGASSFDLSLLRRGITHRIFLHENNFSVISRGEQLLPRIRDTLSARIGEIFSAESAALFRALWFADRSYITKKTVTAFRRAGVLHTLAASGLHVGIIVMIPFAIGAAFSMDRRLLHICALFMLALYLLLADAPVSLTRAFIMYSAYSAAVIFSLKRNPYNSLFIAASAVVLIEPSDIYSLGFILSFSAVLGIILFYRHFESSFSWLPGWAAASFSMTLSAQIFTVPVLLICFEEINLIGIISNLAVIPAVGILLASSIFIGVLSFVNFNAALIASVPVEQLYSLTKSFIETAASLGGHFHGVIISPALILLILTGCIPALPLTRCRKPLSVFSLASILFLWVFLSQDRDPGPKIIFFRGDGSSAAALISSGRGVVAGDIPGPAAARFIAETLNREQVDDTVLVLKSGSADEIAAYLVLAKEVPVSDCFIDPGFEMGYRTFSLFSVFEREGVNIVIREISGDKSAGNIPEPDSPYFIEQSASLLKPGIPLPLPPLYADLPPETIKPLKLSANFRNPPERL
jgi:ComEC/Rec2-related protein